MELLRCFRCMEETAGYPCSHCGYDPAADRGPDYGLQPGTILNGKYVAGTILGQGGFGITYVGWDLALESKIAIKEYYPSGQVVRDNTSGSALRWLRTPQSEAARDMGKEMFLKEARKMTRVRSIPQVVHVHDLFQENGTAYIVMDFVEGQTLKAYLAKNGPLRWNEVRDIFFPAIQAMDQVHQAGLIHRDLSPDNLMLLPNGGVQILDLGAAKDLNINSGISSIQVAKGGFSPLEQYTQQGGSGTWTDVYAMAATMYFSLTGEMPPAALDRVDADPICWSLPRLRALPRQVLEALKRAMTVSARTRTQTMAEFLAQLESGDTRSRHTPRRGLRKGQKRRTPLLPMLAAVLVILLALLALLALWPGQKAAPQPEAPAQAERIQETKVPLETKVTAPTEPEPVFPLSVQEQTISAGELNTVAIGKDGTLFATRNNEYGQNSISHWTDIVAVSTGRYQTVGLKDDGTVVSTRGRYQGDTSADWTDIVAISAGTYHTVGLRSDGTVVTTFINAADKDYGQCDIPADWTDIVAISAGTYHTVGLRVDGTVVATEVTAEQFDNGQCEVSGWTDIVAISAGWDYTVGLKADGTVVATNLRKVKDDHGQCNVSEWKDIVAISAGLYHTVGLKADGTVVATGYSGGLDKRCDVSGWRDIVAISAGISHTVGLKADGTIVATGSDAKGQCSVSDWPYIRIPGIFPLSVQAQTISAGVPHTVAIKQDGSVVAEGSNSRGRCRVSDWTDIVAVSAAYHTVGLKADGTVVTAGGNAYGRCDTSDWRGIVAISANSRHTVGLKADGTVVATKITNSYDDDGQCDVSDWAGIVAISAGAWHTVGLKADGTAVATGYNGCGQCDITHWRNLVAISAGVNHTVGLRLDGTVTARGLNTTNQCDTSGWRNIVAVSAGAYHTVGLKADGTVVATKIKGSEYDFGQCEVSGWTEIVAISAGACHTVGLKADGTVVSTEIKTDNTEINCGQDKVSDWTDIRIPGTTP